MWARAMRLLSQKWNIMPILFRGRSFANEKKAKLRIIPITSSGELIIDEYKTLLNGKTKLVAIGHISNTLGTINRR